VFETIVRNAVSLCGGLFANVFRFDGELLHYVASHNVGPSYADMIRAKYPMRPGGGNVTGITSLSYALTTKRLQLLHELVPKSAAIAVLLDPHAAEFAPEEREAKEAARALGRDILVVQAGTTPDLEAAFATISHARPGALLVGAGAFLSRSQHQQIVAFAARQALITIYLLREAVVAGGLMSYGTSQPDTYRQAGVYAARILKACNRQSSSW
jgi:putative ABC transport system substrate-binding protein